MSDEVARPEGQRVRTAGEAGWHASRYNLFARIPGSDRIAVINLFRNTLVTGSPLMAYMLSIVEELDENHPVIEHYVKRGLVCNFDEREALETMWRIRCSTSSDTVSIVICPTMKCNFDCTYCFESRQRGKMPAEVRDDVVSLAKRMLDASDAKNLNITWYGGEPLLAPDVIESVSRRLIELAEQRGCAYAAEMVTNGYLLTQDMADMMQRCRISFVQITIDGIGATHDATRRLAGGGASFERIVSNLRDLRLPFKVQIRCNVHEGNRSQIDEVKALVRRISEESGNTILFYPVPVLDSAVADGRGEQVDLLHESTEVDVALHLDAPNIPVGLDHICGAQEVWSVLVDSQGNLHKCSGFTADDPQFSFGHVHDWDPAKPVSTASNPRMLTSYLNSASPVPDDECRECVWLPVCGGGCPHYRILGGRKCLPYRDDPERYVLAAYARSIERKR